MNLDANTLHKILRRQNWQYLRISVHRDQVGMQDEFNILKSINIIHRKMESMTRKHMMNSIDEQKKFEKIQYCFVIKTLNKIVI